jgi:two-component system, LytTR family, response regulator
MIEAGDMEEENVKKYTILLVDDRAEAADNLRKGIEDISPDTFNIVILDDIGAMKEIDRNSYDAYFLDIEMPVHNGFELAVKIKEKEKDALILFQTEYEDYSVWGYDYDIFRFISKYKMMEMLPNVIKALLEELDRRDVYMEVYNHAGNIVQIPVFAIQSAYTVKGRLLLITEWDTFTVHCNMNEFLSDYFMMPFAMPQKGYIVNLAFIDRLDYEENMIYMKMGYCVKISRRKRAEFYQRYSLGY